MITALQTGFRPLFLAASLLAAVIVPLWGLAWTGHLALPTALPGVVWHAHELLLGFTGAVLAGFLLTAVGNWTGRPTLTGAPLAALVALWVVGRVGASLPGAPALGAVADLGFWVLFAVGIGRPLVATRNRRNLVFLVLVALLGLLDLGVHLWPGSALLLLRGALDVFVVIMVVIAARIVPMFTANALPGVTVRRLPTVDKVAAGGAALLLVTELAGAPGPAVAAGALVAGVALLVRGAAWAPLASLRHPLLGVLHLGHLWLAVGLLLRGVEALGAPVPSTAATHALTAGAIGTLTVGMMARVALGHTGRPLVAPPLATAAFALVTGAALVRLLAGLMVAPAVTLPLAGALFGAGFAAYALGYAHILLSPRADGRPG